MKALLKGVVFVLGAILISACSEDESGFPELPGEPITANEIVGVWDSSSGNENGYDEFYVVVRDDGTFSDFDYQGDSVDNGSDCYEKESGAYRFEGDGIFVINFNGDSQDYRVRITKEQSLLYLAYEDGEDESWFNMTGQLTESDLTPLCSN